MKEKLSKHPRILNLIHALGICDAYSQMTLSELQCIERNSKGKHIALEIGTMMGVSAAIIAKSLAPDGNLYCIDPWEAPVGRNNPCYLIACRELRRKNVFDKVTFIRGYSGEVEERLPVLFDFILVDGDHSYEGIEIDWALVRRKLRPGGIVCLHDTTIPEEEPWRDFGSNQYFDQIIQHDPMFQWIERCYSLNVLERIL